MLSVLRSAAPQQQSQSSSDSKTKFRNVLGLGNLPKDIDSPSRQQRRNSPLPLHQRNLSLSRRSVDTITDIQNTKKKKSGWNHSPDIPLSFDTDVVNVPRPEDIKYPAAPQSMPSTRRMPFRLDGQDGPWTISVAESLHDPSSYSLYVKSEFSISFFHFYFRCCFRSMTPRPPVSFFGARFIRLSRKALSRHVLYITLAIYHLLFALALG